MVNEHTKENWHEWLHEWGDRFLLFARQQTSNFVEAEDVLQDAVVHIWSTKDRFPRVEPGLVFTHIRRMAIDRARMAKRRKTREAAYASDNQPKYFEASENGFPDEVQQALQEIPLEQREVVVLKVWGEQTFESIGQTLDISANTAASRYRYGLEHLRRLLKEEER